jgi:hypothetical protein
MSMPTSELAYRKPKTSFTDIMFPMFLISILLGIMFFAYTTTHAEVKCINGELYENKSPFYLNPVWVKTPYKECIR